MLLRQSESVIAERRIALAAAHASLCCTIKTDESCSDEPSGLAIDSNDNLYVADTLNDRLLGFLNPLA